MGEFERLESALRKNGFLVGVMTEGDKACTEALLKDLYAIFPAYGRARANPSLDGR